MDKEIQKLIKEREKLTLELNQLQNIKNKNLIKITKLKTELKEENELFCILFTLILLILL